MNPRFACALLLVTLTACSARGGGGGGGGLDPGDASSDDAAGGDASTGDDARIAVADMPVTRPDSGDPPADRPAPMDVAEPPRDVPAPPPDVPAPPPDVPAPPPDALTGDPCTDLCERVATTAGCSSDRAMCQSTCNEGFTRFPACRSQFEALLRCGVSTGITCSGMSFNFPRCTSLQSAFQSCVLPMLNDASVPDVAPPPDASTTDFTRACPTDMTTGPTRDCGWLPGRTLSCTPGRTVTVGCIAATDAGAMCATPLGSCSGDPVLRVCAGAGPCAQAGALASVDDTCGLCPLATVTCPSTGTLHVMTGAYSSTTPGTCVPALR